MITTNIEAKTVCVARWVDGKLFACPLASQDNYKKMEGCFSIIPESDLTLIAPMVKEEINTVVSTDCEGECFISDDKREYFFRRFSDRKVFKLNDSGGWELTNHKSDFVTWLESLGCGTTHTINGYLPEDNH